MLIEVIEIIELKGKMMKEYMEEIERIVEINEEEMMKRFMKVM